MASLKENNVTAVLVHAGLGREAGPCAATKLQIWDHLLSFCKIPSG